MKTTFLHVRSMKCISLHWLVYVPIEVYYILQFEFPVRLATEFRFLCLWLRLELRHVSHPVLSEWKQDLFLRVWPCHNLHERKQPFNINWIVFLLPSGTAWGVSDWPRPVKACRTDGWTTNGRHRLNSPSPERTGRIIWKTILSLSERLINGNG